MYINKIIAAMLLTDGFLKEALIIVIKKIKSGISIW